MSGGGAERGAGGPMLVPNSPHVVYLLDRYPELSQTFVRDEIAELRRQGLRVTVIALARGTAAGGEDEATSVLSEHARPISLREWVRWGVRQPGRASKVARAVFAMRGTYARLTARQLPGLVRALQTQGVARVHSHFAWGGSAVGSYLAAGLGVPFSLTLHARDMYVHPRRLQAKLDAADTPITVCEYNVRWLAEHGYRASGLRVVPCGVEVPELAASASGGFAIAVGRLVAKKGFDILIEAFALCAGQNEGLRLDIVGDGPERERLEAQIGRLGMRDRVHLLGALPHEEVLRRIGDASVFALPCRTSEDGDSDALPVVLREAMARAVPVIATPIAGIPELVDETVGWLVPAENPTAFAAALGEALSTPGAARRRGAAARDRIVQHYTLEDTVDLLQHTLAITR
jgi:colanic acid/amylovoran biosynthesis glycosyltransferase